MDGKVNATGEANGAVRVPNVIQIETPHATASISVFGGQVLSWQPVHTAEPVLWLSDRAVFDGSKAIRGGVPVCWPWFGPHPTDPVMPAHGYARVVEWRVERIATSPDAVEIVLVLDPGRHLAAGSSPVLAQQRIRIGRSLEISLTTCNRGDSMFAFSEGFHTYFQVSDVAGVRVEGLEGVEFIDLPGGKARRRQGGPVLFAGEVGRVFVNSAETCVIDDPGFRRRIVVEKSGSSSTAIWNPASAVAATMPDLGAVAWRRMVCVETANAYENSLRLAPSAVHTMTARYTVSSSGAAREP